MSARAIYTRGKNSDGKWRYSRIVERRGIKTGSLTGPFYVRYTAPTKSGQMGQHWHTLAADTYPTAKTESEQIETALEAKARGLTVAEFDSFKNANRISLLAAIETYLQTKSNKAKKTVAQYRLTLDEFAAITKVSFLDEITESVLRNYKRQMETKFAGKTIDTRMGIVYFLLKKNHLSVRLPKDEMPTVEEEPAIPYTNDELKKLFVAMTPEETIRYKFFLGTGCRDKEVTFASWQDMDWSKSKFHVRRKPDVGFTPKSHESRTIPIPAELLNLLKQRKKTAQHDRWIFVNDQGRPDNHFLRKLKRIAKRAGLNCGNCITQITEGKYHRKQKKTVSCKDRPVCEHFYLHRFRKTCATHWHDKGISVRTIQVWLGHKDLETTQGYLGVMTDDQVRGKVDDAFDFRE